MDAEEMKKRTKGFAINCGHLVLSLSKNVINNAYSNQLVRASSSVGANYRATRRAKSNADFVNKFKIVEEELDESLFFWELIAEFNKDKRERIVLLYKAGDALLKIIVSDRKSVV